MVQKCKLGPWILLVVSLCYLFGGAGVLTIMEQPQHLNRIARLRMQLGRYSAQRQLVLLDNFVRNVTMDLFNNSRFLLFLTADQSHQVHELVSNNAIDYGYHVLSQYVTRQIEKDWSYWNAFDYNFNLLTLLGHSWDQPSTIGGQVFVFWFAVCGIPLFIWTITSFVLDILLPCFGSGNAQSKLFVVVLVSKILALTCVLCLWLMLCALVVFLMDDCTYWEALLTAVFTFLTIQTPQESVQAVYFVPVALVIMGLIVALIIQHLQLRNSIKTQQQQQVQNDHNGSGAILDENDARSPTYGEIRDTDVFL